MFRDFNAAADVLPPKRRLLGGPFYVFLRAEHAAKGLHGQGLVAERLHDARRLAHAPERLEAQPGEASPARVREAVDKHVERQLDDRRAARLGEHFAKVHDVVEQVGQPRVERRVRVELREPRLDDRRAVLQDDLRGEHFVPDRGERREVRPEVRHPGGRGLADDVPGLERDSIMEVGAAPRLEGLLVEGLARGDRGHELVPTMRIGSRQRPSRSGGVCARGWSTS